MTETLEQFKMQPTLEPAAALRLPPLILHPFSTNDDAKVLVESSRANLILRGMLPNGRESRNDLDRQFLAGRYAEIKMLFYIGKDLVRWIEQCVEAAGKETPQAPKPTFESFTALLLSQPPDSVKTKLLSWGVVDFVALFRRALGLHQIFQDVPGPESFTEHFLRHYHQYADQWIGSRMERQPYPEISADSFTFDLFASGEYTQMLERNWHS